MITHSKPPFGTLGMDDITSGIVVGKEGPRVHTPKDANEPFRHLVECMSEAAVVVDRDGAILYSNGRLDAMLGHDNLAGNSFLEFVIGRHRRRAKKLFTTGSTSQIVAEMNLMSAKVKTIGVRAAAAPMVFDGQPCVALIVTALDKIAGLKSALEEAKQHRAKLADTLDKSSASERIYRAIGESIDYGVWICDPKGRNIYASPSFLKMVGLTQQQCSDFGWGDVLHPDDAARTIAAWQECVRTEGKWDIVHRFHGADKQWHQVLARGVSVRDDAGKMICWAGINLDISEIKEAAAALEESEARFRAAQEASLDAFVIYTLVKDDNGRIVDLRIIYANRMMAEHYQTESEKLIGRLISEVLPQASLPGGLIERHSRVILSGRPDEYLLDYEDIFGVKKYFRNLVVPFGSYVATTFRDVTEMIVRTNVLATAKAEAERAVLSRSKFLAAASHDLRQPVQTLVLLLAMLKTQETSPSFSKVLGLAENALEGLEGLLNSILNVSCLDAGIVMPQIETVNVGNLLDRLAKEYSLIATGKGLRLKIMRRALHIQTDPVLLERALRNLIENAIRYTDKGGVLLGLCRRGSDVRIDVVDTGIGIPADKQSQIFEEFYQAGNSGRHENQGLGLGLSIVARLARLLGMEIEVSSRERRGSRFSLLSPADDIVPQKPAVLFETPRKVGGRILIIEDNTDVRTGLQLLTEGWGYEAVTASSGEEALTLCFAQALPFDVIMADHRLGDGLTGTDTAKKICAQARRSIPTVIVTGDTDSEKIAEIKESGFEVMHKPVGAVELRRKLAQLVQEGAKKFPRRKTTRA